MGDLDAMLRACVTKPDDTGRRLILADWFEDRGRPEAGPLRLPGYWWLVPDQTQLQVASVVYWRAPKAARVLSRLGSVADFRGQCGRAGYYYSAHSDARTWMGAKIGWMCHHHLDVVPVSIPRTGSAVLDAEGAFIGNRSPCGRFKKRLAEARP